MSTLSALREVSASEARTKFYELLTAVEQGEALIITRHSQPVARVVPEASDSAARIEATIAGIRERAKARGPIKLEELLSARDEGRRYGWLPSNSIANGNTIGNTIAIDIANGNGRINP